MSHCKTLAEPPCLVSGLLDSSLLDGCLGICFSPSLHEKPPPNDQGHEPMFKTKRDPSQMDSPLHGGETRGKATQGGAATRAPGLIALRHRSESSWILSLQIANYQSLDHQVYSAIYTTPSRKGSYSPHLESSASRPPWSITYVTCTTGPPSVPTSPLRPCLGVGHRRRNPAQPIASQQMAFFRLGLGGRQVPLKTPPSQSSGGRSPRRW